MRKPALAALVIAVGVLAALPFRSSPLGTDTVVERVDHLPSKDGIHQAEPEHWVEYVPPVQGSPTSELREAPRWNNPQPARRVNELAELPRYRPELPPERPRDLPLTFDDLMLPLDASRPIGGSMSSASKGASETRFARTVPDSEQAPPFPDTKPAESANPEVPFRSMANTDPRPAEPNQIDTVLIQPGGPTASVGNNGTASTPARSAAGRFAGQRDYRKPSDTASEVSSEASPPRKRHWIVQPKR